MNHRERYVCFVEEFLKDIRKLYVKNKFNRMCDTAQLKINK
jgi:hypothetical protein